MNPADRHNPILSALGFEPGDRVAIFHADDVGMCHGSNIAFAELSGRGAITSGAVMVPCPWFLEVVDLVQADPGLDLGVHLTLTSEWTTYRWGPISTTSRNSGLVDEQGCFPRRLSILAEMVVPEAAEEEMRAQIEKALALGIEPTHLDTHMGAAFLPQLFEIYLRLGREYKLPLLLPGVFSDYASVLDFNDISTEGYSRRLMELESQGWPLMDHFRMTPGVPSAQSDSAYRNLVSSLPQGLTFVALHPTKSGEIEAIVPSRAHFRTDEYRLLSDKHFLNFIKQQDIKTIGFRPLCELFRQQALVGGT